MFFCLVMVLPMHYTNLSLPERQELSNNRTKCNVRADRPIICSFYSYFKLCQIDRLDCRPI